MILLLDIAAYLLIGTGCASCSRAPLAVVPTAPLAADSVLLASLDQSADDALALARRLDAAGRTASGELPALSAAEHARRAGIYNRNRLFPQAREHWQALVARYPTDAQVPAALFGIGRAFYQERRFTEALPYFERLGRDYAQTAEGREGFYYIAPTLLRLDRTSDAARGYEGYIERFPAGERIESAHLNLIDTLREAGRPADAAAWVARTRSRFPRTATSYNALFARLRLELAGGEWRRAAATADELRREPAPRGANTSLPEILFLRAYGLERAGRIAEAVAAYDLVADNPDSYYGGRATARMIKLGAAGARRAQERSARLRAAARAGAANYPAPFRAEIMRAARGRTIDPRFVLAVMRQESGFRPDVKSGAAARGLMQLTVDTAAKYAPRVGLTNVTEARLYEPATSILLASEYLTELDRMFPALPEAVAASYNGGEDNAARWAKRASEEGDEPALFAAEVGFTETKDYVFKVLANYRIYRELYTRDLQPAADRGAATIDPNER